MKKKYLQQFLKELLHIIKDQKQGQLIFKFTC